MNEELREIMEEAQELSHKAQKLYQKAQKMGQRTGYNGGYNRMGQNTGNMNNQSMGQSGGVFWGQQPMGGMGMGNQFPREESWFDPRFM